MNKSIEQILKNAFPQELPYGFAERVARAAMAQGERAIWDLLLNLTPRAGIAIGAVATLLLLLGLLGEGPGLFESITEYNSFSSLIPLP
jgi:hypothetical protein